MSEDSTKKVVLPLSHNARGDIRGLVMDEQGVRPVEFTRIEEGKPIMGDYVALSPREGSPLLNAEFTRIPGTGGARPPEVRTSSGPPRVSTPAYRDGYDRIFGKKQDIGEA